MNNQENYKQSSGITGIKRIETDIRIPENVKSGESWRYGAGFPFQLAKGKVGVFTNIRRDGTQYIDLEAGNDIIIFDKLSGISGKNAVPVSRTAEEVNPKTGEPSIIVRYDVLGGFVPLGCKLANGSAHPHGGTGFGLSQTSYFPIKFSKKKPFTEYDNVGPLEYFEFSYDGKEFKVTKSERMARTGGLLSGYGGFAGGGLSCAIPDGEDLLFGIGFEKSMDTQKYIYRDWGYVAGVSRWRHSEEGWSLVSFVPVTGEGNFVEATLIRDIGGNLLLGARGGSGGGSFMHTISVWNSKDNGQTWEQIIDKDDIRSEAPICLNQAADGTPYVGANPYGHNREVIYIWLINKERTDLESPILVRDCRKDFGLDLGGYPWRADHPSASTVLLSDGEWHNLLFYRVVGDGEVRNGILPAPQTGLYIDEVLSKGKPIPTWNF